MAITLGGVGLPDCDNVGGYGRIWTSDMDLYAPIGMHTRYSGTGAMSWQEFEIQSGQPIDLVAASGYCAIAEATFTSLQALYRAPGSMTLDIRGAEYKVVWRREDAPALDLRRIAHDGVPWRAGSIKLITI